MALTLLPLLVWNMWTRSVKTKLACQPACFPDSDPLSYTQDNVSVRMLSSRGEETISGKLEITKEKHGHVVTWTAYPPASATKEQQQRYDENSAGVWEDLSADSAVSYHVGGKDKSQSLDSVKIKKENGTSSASGDSPTSGPHCIVTFEVTDITSYRCRQVADTHELTLNLSDGTRLPTFIFIERRYEHFIRALHEHISFKRSRKDPLLYLVQMPAVEALHKSFDQLDLYPESSSRYDVIRKFLVNPTWDATWDGFAKVANYVTGTASGLPGDEYRLGYGYFEEQQPDSLTGLEISAHSEEPGFEVVIRTLPKRTEVKRGTPLCHEEWAMAHDPEGRILNEASLRERIFRGGIAADLRREVWPFLLEYYSFDSTYKEREALRKKLKDYYYRMKLQWKSINEDQESRFADYRERKNLVEKDVSRTDRTHVFYQGENNAKVEMLNDILMTYVMYNFDLGYVQGMSDLLSPILMVMDNEEDAFWCFVGFIKRVMSNFDLDQSGMKKQLTQLFDILAVAVPKLAMYLEEHESGNLYFCFRWLLVLFKREFKCEEIMRLWEVLWTDLPCKNFHLLLCVAILDHEKDLLIENNYGLNEIFQHINDMCYRIDLELILSTAEAIVEQLKGSTKLPESVQDALGIHIANGAPSVDASDAAAIGNPDINAPASPESLHGGQRTCSTSSVEVLSDGDVEASS
ncbi:TBC1 domain family member 15 isoform X1 [Rhipicephalus sanguineus]|uniref:TBC1 domain family member 15 isoform X1 n=1 Tax=Rhipicephalus sanguineus TaxID=34632 RepID=UPI0020C4E1CA|nr:TBC1 domain family member 15 isoform X1 [Rhipicephalus sanguineus]